MFCKPGSLLSGFAAGILVASLAMAQQQSETYRPGSFNPPYNGGGGYYGGWGGGGWGGWGANMGVGSTAAGSYLTGMGNALLEERIAGNQRQVSEVLMAAEAGLLRGAQWWQ